MKREELYPIDGAVCTHGKDYLNKDKADKVMDAMEARIKELEERVADAEKRAEKMSRNYEWAQSTIKELENKLKDL